MRAQVSKAGRTYEAGFTLIELLVVLVILVMLASFVGPRVVGYLGSSRAKAAKVQIERLSAAVELFRLDVGRYPTSSESLRALTQAPSGLSGWNGPYLDKKDVPLDPWGRPYIYRSPGQQGPFEILSLGADNQPGGQGEDADITNR